MSHSGRKKKKKNSTCYSTVIGAQWDDNQRDKWKSHWACLAVLYGGSHLTQCPWDERNVAQEGGWGSQSRSGLSRTTACGRRKGDEMFSGCSGRGGGATPAGEKKKTSHSAFASALNFSNSSHHIAFLSCGHKTDRLALFSSPDPHTKPLPGGLLLQKPGPSLWSSARSPSERLPLVFWRPTAAVQRQAWATKLFLFFCVTQRGWRDQPTMYLGDCCV